MKADIRNRDDITKLIDAFYEKVRSDEVIGYIFNDVARVDWEQHLPVMYDFWENVLFFTGGYNRNAMAPHIRLNRIESFKKEHFKRWLELFNGTVDDIFEGEKAELAKQRALSIATMMELKLIYGDGPFSMKK
jgi:hemoglobin